MIASQTTPAGNPAKSPFNNPASGLDMKACRGRRGLWLGFHDGGIVRGSQTLHGLHVPSELLFGPLKKFSLRPDCLPK